MVAQVAAVMERGRIYSFGERRRQRMEEIEAVQAGLPNEVDNKLAHIRLSERGRQFLSYIRPISFGSKGYQQREGRDNPGISCAFDLSAFTRGLAWRKKDVLYVRDQLVELCILTFESDGNRTGQGRLFWNTNVEEWQSKVWGGARKGAGNPEWVKVDHSQLESNHIETEKPFQVGNKTLSSWEQTADENPFKLGIAIYRELEETKGKKEKKCDAAIASSPLPDCSSEQPKTTTPKITEDAAEYRLATYLYDGIKKIDEHVDLGPRTIKGLTSWIDPQRGKGLRQLLAERGATERATIQRIIDWLSEPETTAFWQTRFLNHKNNPGRILYDNYAEMANASRPRQPKIGNARADPVYPQPAHRVAFKRRPPVSALARGGNDDTGTNE